MPLYQLVEDNAAISEEVARRFVERFAGLEDDLVRKLTRLVERLPREVNAQGKTVFKRDASTTAILNEVRRVLEGVMQREQLREAVRDLLPEFDRIADNVRTMHGMESNIKVSKALLNDTKQRMIQLTTDTVVDVGYEARFVDPAKRVLYNLVNYGAEVIEAERVIRSLVHGKELAPLTLKGTPRKVPGLLAQYAGQVARDSLNQYEGQVHKEIAIKYELTNYRYIGNILPGHIAAKGKNKGKLVGGSRPQCVRWVNMGIITAEQLPAELVWMMNNGSGWIPGTTPTTWPIFRGGFNCMHTALPTRREP